MKLIFCNTGKLILTKHTEKANLLSRKIYPTCHMIKSHRYQYLYNITITTSTAHKDMLQKLLIFWSITILTFDF